MATHHGLTLTDLLDRVLDRGIVLHADVLITVADVPLVALRLQALLAGVETMRQYGVMTAMIAQADAEKECRDALRAQEKAAEQARRVAANLPVRAVGTATLRLPSAS